MKKSKELLLRKDSIQIIQADSRSEVRRFIDFQYRLYKNEKNFVPPLRMDAKKMAGSGSNALFINKDIIRLLAYKDDKPAGRIIAGIDHSINRKKNCRKGYITLFECIEDYRVAEVLFDVSVKWLKEMNITYVKGPVSPTGGDDYRGLLINAFDRPPVIMNSYNFPYYAEFFDRYGFKKDLDLYAYYYDLKNLDGLQGIKRKKAVEYAMKRYGYSVDVFDIDNTESEIRDIKKILDIAMPEDWTDMVPPSLDSIREFATTYKKLAEPDMIYIARSQGGPIGFSVALPNYNEIMIHMKGRLLPFGFLKLLAGKKKIKSGRSFILFVIPEYRKKGVSGSMFYKTFEACLKKGYVWGEGSTIGDINYNMRKDAEGAGGQHYKTYRIYGKEI